MRSFIIRPIQRNGTSKAALMVVALLACILQGANSWMSPKPHSQILSPSQQLSARKHTTRVYESPSPEEAEGKSVPDITGKDIYQRVFYRLSHFSEVEKFNAIVVEERVRFKPDPSKGEGSLKPVGPRTLILRDGDVEEGDIGDELFEINVQESLSEDATHLGAGNSKEMEATIATILYLASNAKCIEGEVLEVGCGLGLAGLLGSIGAGALKTQKEGQEAEEKEGEGDAEKADDYEDILTIPKNTKMTDDLLSLTLSDEDKEMLKLTAANVKKSRVPASQVLVENMQYRTRALWSHNERPKSYHTVIASDLDYTFPEAKELARCVAHRLDAFSNWELDKGNSASPPTFVHVCPDQRDVSFFHKFLTKGYSMEVKSGYLKLEKIVFKFQMLPESEPEDKLDDLEMEVQAFHEYIYQSMRAQHDPMYSNGSGDYFFPMENGLYDNVGATTYLEPDPDGSKRW